MNKSRLLGAIFGCLIALIWTSSNASLLYAANESGIWEFDPVTGLGSNFSTFNAAALSYGGGYLFASNGSLISRYEIATDTWLLLSNRRDNVITYGDGVLYTGDDGGFWSDIIAIDTVTGDASTFNGLSHVRALAYGATIVPLPPALWLFGSGLLGLIGMARRKAV